MNATSSRPATLIWGVLCGAAGGTGLWALVAPAGFFSSFPGLGLRWVTGDGPYNEHLTRDVGAFNLALVAFTVGVLRVAPQAAAWAAVAWEVYALPHLAYHLSHLATCPA